MSQTIIRALLALIVVMGFYVVLILWGMGILKFDAENQSMLILVGTASTAFGAVIGWHFGSSEGSARKTEMLKISETLKVSDAPVNPKTEVTK